MTNFVKTWKDYINEELLVESRFSDALAYAQNLKKGAKQYRVYDVFEQMTDKQIKMFMDSAEKSIKLARTEDPSGDNKYLMWIARFVRKEFMRRLQKHSKNWGTSPIGWNDAADDPEDSTFHPDQMAKSIAGHVLRAVENLLPTIQDYHMLKLQKVVKRDIYDFDPTNQVGDFTGFVQIGMRQFREREQKAALKQKAASEADDILDTEDYVVIRPNSEGASCYYGWGTRWCISARESRNYFNQYTGEGKVFYFVMFRHLANDNPYKKMALVYGRDQGYGSVDPEQVFDAADDEVGDVGLVDAITQNILVKLLKKNKQIGSDYQKAKDTLGSLNAEQMSTLTDNLAAVIEDPDSDREMALEIGKALFPNTYAEDIDLDISTLTETFDEMIQETYSDIAGSSAYHAEDNPGGPGSEQYEEKYNEYEFEHIYVSYDEYDQNQWYWDAGYSIETTDYHFADIKLPEDVDIDEFADVVHKAIDLSGMYPDEVEGDDYDQAARIRFTPDYDETNGLDGFERFLDRMAEYDTAIGDDGFWNTLSQELMDAGLTTGGLIELRDILEGIDFKNVDYEIKGTKMEISLEMEPTLARPKGISGTYLRDMITTFAETEGESVSKVISSNTINKIDKAIKDKYDDIWNQMTLPGLERGEEEEAEDLDALPMIDMEFYPRADKIRQWTHMGQKVKMSTRSADKGAAGINISFPHTFVMSLTNAAYWDGVGANEEERGALVNFLKWIDQDEVLKNIEALLQESLNNMVLDFMKKNPPQSAKDPEKKSSSTGLAGTGEQIPGTFNEPQVAEKKLNEVYKRWAKMIK